MKKIISFSLYGSDWKYTNGALCNAKLSKLIYPDWVCRFYCGYSVPENIITELRNHENCEVIMMEEKDEFSYMMWRFLPIDESDVDVMIVRDADSRLSHREKVSVDLFMNSDFLLHSIRDEGNHTDIMGGMWGIKKNDRIDKMIDLCKEWIGGMGYNSDQWFLREKIVPKFLDSYMIHCSTYIKNFPIEPPSNRFYVGMVFPGDNFGRPHDFIFY
jgi:hypothetical protein